MQTQTNFDTIFDAKIISNIIKSHWKTIPKSVQSRGHHRNIDFPKIAFSSRREHDFHRSSMLDFPLSSIKFQPKVSLKQTWHSIPNFTCFVIDLDHLLAPFWLYVDTKFPPNSH